MITLCGFGVSNYYNKLKLVLLEKGVPFEERLVYPWQRDRFNGISPLGRIPFIETEEGGLSESQVILEFIEERYPSTPLYPAGAYQRARCRELIQHLELNCEWVARRLYKEACFGGVVSAEMKREVRTRLDLGLQAVARLCAFSPYIAGDEFTAADCVAYVHFLMVRRATESIYDIDLLEAYFPGLPGYMARLDERPHFQAVMRDRESATAAFLAMNYPYEG